MFATLLIVITLQALIHIEIAIHRASQSWTMRYQSASVTLGLPPHTSVGRAVQEVIDVVEATVGRVVSVGARVESGGGGGGGGGRHLGQQHGGLTGLGEYRTPGLPSSSAARGTVGVEDDRTRRLEVTLAAIVPPSATGVQLLDCLSNIRGVTCAAIEETRLNHISFCDEQDLHYRGGGGGRSGGGGGGGGRTKSARGSGRARTEDIGGYREIETRDIQGLDAAHI
jgi:hypothetical protein